MTELQAFRLRLLSLGVDLAASDPSMPPLDMNELHALAGMLVNERAADDPPKAATTYEYHPGLGDDADSVRGARTDIG